MSSNGDCNEDQCNGSTQEIEGEGQPLLDEGEVIAGTVCSINEGIAGGLAVGESTE